MIPWTDTLLRGYLDEALVRGRLSISCDNMDQAKRLRWALYGRRDGLERELVISVQEGKVILDMSTMPTLVLGENSK